MELEIAHAFNEAINAADLDRLEELMSSDHRFVDTAGGIVEGKDACVAAWASFFESFPDYRNVLETIEVSSPGQVVATGRSVCTFEPLDGPARWHASVEPGLVTEWRVEDPAGDSQEATSSQR